MVGLLDSDRNLWGMAGFCGRGNCHSDVGAEFLAGRVAGVVSDVERHFGVLFDSLLHVGCPSADWRPWCTAHAESGVPAPAEQLVEGETFAPLHGEVGFDLDPREPTAQ